MAKIKVTIVTGFLGAGKTTFINKLLQEYPDNKFALVENEFGDVSIDTKLIKGIDAGKMFELKDGCICCTISNEYELILLELAERFPDVDHLIIETTGVADPSNVINPFFANEDVKKYFEYNGTVCLFDSLNFDNQPEKEISLKQIAIADVILINKSDRISESDKMRQYKNVSALNPLAEVLYAELGYSEKFSLNSITDINQEKLLPDHYKPLQSQLNSKTLTFENPIEKEKFKEWLAYNLDIYKQNIYRTKGILYFIDEPYEYFLQGVSSAFELIEGDLTFKTKSQIVFIGKLSEIELEF